MMHADNVNCRHIERIDRPGFSMIEILVTLGIISLVMAITIPAVQRTRSTAQRIDCASRIRQMGQAFTNYESRRRHYPDDNPEDGLVNRTFEDNWIGAITGDLGLPQLTAENRYQIRFTVLSCPSDSLATGEYEWLHTSFLPSAGLSNTLYAPTDGIDLGTQSDQLGLYQRHSRVSAKDVTDGLSNTALGAERLAHPGQSQLPDWSDAPHLWGRLLRTTGQHHLDVINQADECELRPLNPAYSDAQIIYTYYTHVVRPNRVACLNGIATAPYIAIPPSSLHMGGANVVFADGSVHFVGDGIDRRVWWALGTRAGGEVVEEW